MKGKVKNFALKHLKLKSFYSLLPVFVGLPVIIMNNKKEILLGKRDKKMYSYPGFWGLPGGIVDHGEKLEDTAKREAKEEMGIIIRIIKRSKNIYETNHPKKNSIHSVGIPYYAKIIKGVPKPLDETEEVGWFNTSQIKKMKLAHNHKEILKKEGLI